MALGRRAEHEAHDDRDGGGEIATGMRRRAERLAKAALGRRLRPVRLLRSLRIDLDVCA